jgi:hypothetical protein
MGTAVAETQTAMVWTPTISPTPDPNESKIVEWLNAELLNADPLEQTLDAKYQVLDASFPMGNGFSPVFRIDLRCECATNMRCCLPERMFVVTITAMKRRAEKVMEQVPGNTLELQVVCYDHGTYLGVMGAWWVDVKGYLGDQINGFQLGSRVIRHTQP